MPTQEALAAAAAVKSQMQLDLLIAQAAGVVSRSTIRLHRADAIPRDAICKPGRARLVVADLPLEDLQKLAAMRNQEADPQAAAQIDAGVARLMETALEKLSADQA